MEALKRQLLEKLLKSWGIEREKIEIIGKYGTLINASGMLLDVYVGYINIDKIEEFNFNKMK